MSRVILKAVIFLSLLSMISCASALTLEQMKTDVESYRLPYQAQKDSTLVYVVRPSSLGTLIRFNVFLDDEQSASEMGYTRGSQYICFYMPSGSHVIKSKAENWAEIIAVGKPGQIIFIQQEAQMGLLMARNSLSILDEVTGTYHVKHTSPGTIIKQRK